jgi:two-component system, OmpR family, sensor histidine kinase KdpD
MFNWAHDMMKNDERSVPQVNFMAEDIGDITQAPLGVRGPTYGDYGVTILLVIIATVVGWLGRRFWYLPDYAIIYLYVIVVSALLFGWVPAIWSSLLSVLAFDFFFVPPVLELDIADVHYLVTFSMMFLVGLLVSRLASRIRREQRSSIEKERRTAALLALSRALGSATNEFDAASLLARHTALVFGARSALLMPDTKGVFQVKASSSDIRYQSDEQLLVARVCATQRAAGRGTEDYPDASVAGVPVQAAGATIGVLVVELPPTSTFGVQQRELLESFGRQGGVCIAGLRSAKEAKLAETRAHTEAVRSALLSAVSHDFRTPLAVITEAATMLRDDGGLLSPTQQAEMIVDICNQAERMDRLISNLLDMTRLASGELAVQREWVPCDELIGAALNIVKNKTSGLTIQLDVSPHLPLVNVDPSLIEQLLANLFENAVKYAGSSSTVEVSAHHCNNELVIEVADNGPGIPVGSEERIFERFYRATPRSSEGTGLGLAICSAIIELHTGRIQASNRPPGGAVFSVTIPIVGTAPELPSEHESAVTTDDSP